MKMFFFSFVFVLITLLTFAQEVDPKRLQGTSIEVNTNKGDYMIGGTLALDLKAVENQDQLLRTALYEDSDRFNLRVDGAYALKDDWFVGMGFLWGVANRQGDYEDPNSGEISNIKLHSTTYSVRPFIKSILPLTPNHRFNLVVQTELGFGLDQSIEETTTNELVTRRLTREWGMGLGVRPGLLAFVIKNFAVEASVNVAGVSFTITEIEQTNAPNVKVEAANLDLKIDLLQLNLGFIGYF